MKEICGCIHLHTTYSDGDSDYPTIIGAARDAGLDYIAVTDHATLGGQAEYQGRRGGVFVLVGYEHADVNELNHYLAFGVSEPADKNASPQEYVNRIKDMGGAGFIAHPAEKRDYLGPYPWTEWGVTGFDGIELWNQLSDWIEQLRDRWDRLWDKVERVCGRQPGEREWGGNKKWWKFWKLFFPSRYIKDAPPELLERWDAMNRERFVSAIAGADAHTRKITVGPFGTIYRIFPIDVELRILRTHLFVDEKVWDGGDDGAAAAALLEAMRDGRGFMSNYYRGDARGAKFFLRDESGNVVYPGRQTQLGAALALPLPMTIHAELPLKAQMRLLRNGEVVGTASGKTAAWPVTEPGVYRIEAYRQSRAWIYTNPFPVGEYPL